MKYALKAACHFFAAASAAFVAAGARQPTNEWEWTLLTVGSLGAGTIALKGYLSDASSTP